MNTEDFEEYDPEDRLREEREEKEFNFRDFEIPSEDWMERAKEAELKYRLSTCFDKPIDRIKVVVVHDSSGHSAIYVQGRLMQGFSHPRSCGLWQLADFMKGRAFTLECYKLESFLALETDPPRWPGKLDDAVELLGFDFTGAEGY